MPGTKLHFMAAVIAAALALFVFAQPGSAKHSQGLPLFVPDEANNRVLIYESPFSTGHSASGVLGQPDLTSAALGTTASTMYSPSAFAVDDRGNLWVSDTGNCRVLLFRTPLLNGLSASRVVGEADFNTACAASTPTANSLGYTGDVAVDGHGDLWVVDTGNNRVLRYSPPFTSGMAASLVVGQADFTSGACNSGGSAPTSATLCGPIGIDFDSSDNLWVADTSNNRVLGYKRPFRNGMKATVELGQPLLTAFTSSNSGVSTTALSGPTAITFDNQEHLWVADTGNNRVLLYKLSYFFNGRAATLVLGQTDFTQSSPNQGLSTPTAATLSLPQGLVFDNQEGLFVGDTINNRTLLFVPPFRTGMNAESVLGQVDFTQNEANQGDGPTAATESSPFKGGASLLALGVLGGLMAGRTIVNRLRRRP